jgi:hypothetical protein
MTKKGPLSKSEKFYIENFCEKHDLQTICKDLDRAQPIVKKHIAQCKKSKSAPSDISEQFGYDGGSTIMTPNASEMSDSFRNRLSGQGARQNQCITSIKIK